MLVHGCRYTFASPCPERAYDILVSMAWYSFLASDFARCLWNQILDLFGDQLLGCRQGNWRIRHHNALCGVLFHALSVHTMLTVEESNAAQRIIILTLMMSFTQILNRVHLPILTYQYGILFSHKMSCTTTQYAGNAVAAGDNEKYS